MSGITTVLLDLDGTLTDHGLRLMLATAKPHVYATRILEHFDLHKFFDAVYGAEVDGTHQHKTDLLMHLLACEQLDPASTVMVGDRLHDFDAARANRCRSVGVTWGYGSVDELAAANLPMRYAQ